jgi:hypothetical protein
MQPINDNAEFQPISNKSLLFSQELSPNCEPLSQALEFIEEPAELTAEFYDKAFIVVNGIKNGELVTTREDSDLDLASLLFLNGIHGLNYAIGLEGTPENTEIIVKSSAAYFSSMLSLFLLLANNQDYGLDFALNLFEDAILSNTSKFHDFMIGRIGNRWDPTSSISTEAKWGRYQKGLRAKLLSVTSMTLNNSPTQIQILQPYAARSFEADYFLKLKDKSWLPVKAKKDLEESLWRKGKLNKNLRIHKTFIHTIPSGFFNILCRNNDLIGTLLRPEDQSQIRERRAARIAYQSKKAAMDSKRHLAEMQSAAGNFQRSQTAIRI